MPPSAFATIAAAAACLPATVPPICSRRLLRRRVLPAALYSMPCAHLAGRLLYLYYPLYRAYMFLCASPISCHGSISSREVSSSRFRMYLHGRHHVWCSSSSSTTRCIYIHHICSSFRVHSCHLSVPCHRADIFSHMPSDIYRGWSMSWSSTSFHLSP